MIAVLNENELQSVCGGINFFNRGIPYAYAYRLYSLMAAVGFLVPHVDLVTIGKMFVAACFESGVKQFAKPDGVFNNGVFNFEAWFGGTVESFLSFAVRVAIFDGQNPLSLSFWLKK